MTKIYTINSSQETQIENYCSLEIQKQDITNQYSPTYSEILRIFKEAFSKIDMSQIIKKI